MANYEYSSCCPRGKKKIFRELPKRSWYLGGWSGAGYMVKYLYDRLDYCPFCGTKISGVKK